MKKRILSTILMAAIMLSMAGCGGNTDTPAATGGGEVTTTTTAKEEVAETTTTTAPETEETTTTTEAAPVELPEITGYKLFMNSCLSFSADGKNYVLNIADKKMYEYETEGLDDFYAIRGNVALFGRYSYYNDGVASGAGVYNLKTGEVIASAEENGIMPYSYWEGMNAYIPVVSIEKGFDGDTCSVGVIDENGEWALPLSSDYEISSKEYLDGQLICNDNSPYIVIDESTSKNNIDSKVYDFKNNKFVELSGLVKDVSPEYLDVLLYSENNLLFYDAWSGSYFAKYNTDTNEFVAIGDGDSIGMAYSSENGIALFDRANNKMMCFDSCLNEINFDFSEYEFGRNFIYELNESVAVIDAKNTEGNNYIIVLNKDGSRAAEPIIGTADNAYISGDYVVLINEYGDDYIINHKTGETKKYTDDTLKIVGCDRETGMILVLCDGFIYLADISDPETLINPFEIAE